MPPPRIIEIEARVARPIPMRKRLYYSFATVLLAISVVLVVWEGSFRLRSTNPTQTFIFWAISILTFVVMVTLGWILFRTGVKLYIERQANREGSRIRTKLVLGALTLVSAPVFCLVLGSFYVLSANMNAWFTEPMQNQVNTFVEVAQMFSQEMQDETTAQAGLLAAQPETVQLLRDGVKTPGALEEFCRLRESKSVAIYGLDGGPPVDFWGPYDSHSDPDREVTADYAVRDGGTVVGSVVLTATIPLDVQKKKAYIEKAVHEWHELAANRKGVRLYYIMLESLITLFVLFVATWIALFLARQISVPITAILEGASQVRKGNLKYRVQAKAVDELGLLVRGFNQMTEELESGATELDRRRRFTEAILESIPTGVLSIGADGSIQLVNQALLKIFPPDQLGQATRLEDLFSRDDTAEIKYLMKRARRTGDRGAPDGSEYRPSHLESLCNGGRSGREADLRFRNGAGGHQRIAARSKSGCVARGGPPGGARDQESAHPYRALGPAHRPPDGPSGSAAAGGAHHSRVRRYHLQVGGFGEDTGGRVFAIRPLPGGTAGAQRPQ